ncbi:fibropellin-3-like [Anneissia japonica]|uniref:fibropellin-3-like n=1 Tax=Anneissia japonica TaxID=1529436 RepID=UPI0014258A7B|nr:fibropellin-3-like [Anneissia japonica]
MNNFQPWIRLNLTTIGYSCTCPSGYTGTRCETSVCSLPLASGTATTCPGAQAVLRYYYAGSTSGCTPFAYYCGANANNFESSTLCEAACGVVTTACASAPCLNGGTCSQTTIGYSCTCPSGYTGTRCETSVCSLPLAAGTAATCPGSQGVLRYYYAGSTSGCTPFAYYCGANANNFESNTLCEAACGVTVTPCSTNPCQNGGACTVVGSNYTCTCSGCFTGTNCQTGVYKLFSLLISDCLIS